MPTSQQKTSVKSMFLNGKRVFSIAWIENKPLVISLLTTTLISATLPFAQLGVFGLIVNETISIIAKNGQEFTSNLTNLILLQTLLLFLPTAIAKIDISLETMFRFRFMEQLNILYIQKLSGINVAKFEDSEFHNKLNNANERGTDAIYSLWRIHRNILRNLFGVMVAGIVLASIHWLFLVLSLIGVLPTLFIEKKHGARVWWIWDHEAEKRRLFYNLRHLFFYKQSLTELKLFQSTEFLINKIRALLRGFTEKQVTEEKRRMKDELGGTILFAITLALSLGFLIKLTVGEIILVGTMTFVFGSIRAFQGILESLFRNIGLQEEDNRFVTDIFGIFDTKPILQEPASPVSLDTTSPPRIEFRNVSFKYPKSEQFVLKNFSLTIEPGENLAIVGVNGAGKTTFVKLLNRFYDPTEGEILINGVNLKEVDLEEWREMSSVLFQEYETFNFPVAQAIALGRTRDVFDIERAHDAAQKAEAHSFIEKLPKGYDQMIGKMFKDGVDLSGGQNQRMALARVFYRHSQVVILDEPTASIDSEAEANIFAQINDVMREKTVITISHRFSTVKQSDKICVIKDGQISEYGSHKELMKLNKDYAKLYTNQAKSYQD